MQFNGIDFDTYFNHYPDKNGYFGRYGGVFVDETAVKKEAVPAAR